METPKIHSYRWLDRIKTWLWCKIPRIQWAVTRWISEYLTTFNRIKVVPFNFNSNLIINTTSNNKFSGLQVEVKDSVKIRVHYQIRCKIISSSVLQEVLVSSVKVAELSKHQVWLVQRKREHLYQTNRIITIKE